MTPAVKIDVQRWSFNWNCNVFNLQRGNAFSQYKRFCTKKKRKKKRLYMANLLRILYGVSILITRLWRRLELKIMIKHILINDCLNVCMVRKNWKYIQRFFWNLISNLPLRFFLCPVYIFVDRSALDLLCLFEPPHDNTNKMTVRPAKTQISLGIHPVWAESSLCAQWVAKDPSFLHADSKDPDQTSEDSDQTGRMSRLIWVFAGRKLILLVLSCRGSNTG